MDIKLIQGEFSSNDALELIAQMIHIKIKYHESKINNSTPEEDIKRREAKIKHLQKELFELRNYIKLRNESLKINAIINIGKR
jgi:peptidoglycan hydrolase CwlO-like protein